MTSYKNPVYPQDFPDPFVLKYCGEYWAYCTGPWRDGHIFGVLRSRDLIHWQEVAGAMVPLPGDYPCYWAPEVVVDNGRFYLYYSVGDETNMHIRVAVADHPAGPFQDSGHRLTHEIFAIDAHVFVDDGQRYLFYATDFLDYERIGTGTVVDRLLDPFTLAGQPRPVSRACFDWQIYDPQRVEKGGVCWHTLEGPFVLKRKGIYYQMYSGGNWQNPSYGVAYAVTQDLNSPEEWQQVCDGEHTPLILRTIPEQVIGPGHNSVIRGPDNQQLFCVYHRWGGGNGRQMALDPLDFAGDRLLILGPSHTPRRVPLPPTFTDFFESPTLNERWRVSGPWRRPVGAGLALGDHDQTAAAVYEAGVSAFVVEVSVRAVTAVGGYGVSLMSGDHSALQLRLAPQINQVTIHQGKEGSGEGSAWNLPDNFNFHAYHLLRMEVDGSWACIYLDDHQIYRQEALDTPPTAVTLFADQAEAVFAGFALTLGWQHAFDQSDSPARLGWRSERAADWSVQQQQLTFANPDGDSLLQKGPYLPAYEMVVNARLVSGTGYGLAPAQTVSGAGPLLTVEKVSGTWVVCWQENDTMQLFPLPADFDPAVYQQFRLRKENGRLTLSWEQHEIATLPVTTEPTCVGLYGRRATAVFDMVRVTAVSENTRS